MTTSKPRLALECRQCGASIALRDSRVRYCSQKCKSAHNGRVLTPAQRARLTETQTIWTHKWKRLALDALGGKCVHCGFSDARALQFDHIHGDGHKDVTRSASAGRRQRISRALGSYYKRIAERVEPGRFQLLCANCNWIKRVENGEHAQHMKKEVV